MLEYEGGCPAHGVLHHAVQGDHVGAAPQVLEYLYLPLYLLLLDGFERLDDALLLVGHVDALEHLAVLAAAELADQLVVVLVAPLHHMSLVIPVFSGSRDKVVNKENPFPC